MSFAAANDNRKISDGFIPFVTFVICTQVAATILLDFAKLVLRPQPTSCGFFNPADPGRSNNYSHDCRCFFRDLRLVL